MQEFVLYIRKQIIDTLTKQQQLEYLKSHELYMTELKNEGKLISTQPIEPQGTIVSRRDGNWKAVPYSESIESIGGHYHILAKDLAEAITIAKRNPDFDFSQGTRIEIRPLRVEDPDAGQRRRR